MEKGKFRLSDVSDIPPLMTIFAGPNSGGKSTLREIWGQVHAVRTVIDADAIAREFKLNDIEAGRETLRRVEGYLSRRVSFALETTLSGRFILRQMKYAQTCGCQIHLLYVALDSVLLHQERVEQRVGRGGHHIPPDVIERRYYRSLSNLPEALMIADRADIYTNSLRCELVARIEKGMVLDRSREAPAWALEALHQLGITDCGAQRQGIA